MFNEADFDAADFEMGEAGSSEGEGVAPGASSYADIADIVNPINVQSGRRS